VRICLAQIQNRSLGLPDAIQNHLYWIERAVEKNSDLIIFPELSLSGYNLQQAQQYALSKNDDSLKVFIDFSDRHHITIIPGLPLKTGSKPHIGMIIFQPYQNPVTYSKQMLDADELPFFSSGKKQLFLSVGMKKMAPAICYESLQESHISYVRKNGAQFYLASTAIPLKSIEKACKTYRFHSEKYQIPILMVNGIGSTPDFICGGRSAVWNHGKLIDQLSEDQEAMLIYDI
jgi:predicted amidohydrolase